MRNESSEFPRGDEKRGEVVHVRGSTLDPSADQETGLTTKLGIDATRPLTKPSEKFEPAKILVNRRIARVINEMKKSLLWAWKMCSAEDDVIHFIDMLEACLSLEPFLHDTFVNFYGCNQKDCS